MSRGRSGRPADSAGTCSGHTGLATRDYMYHCTLSISPYVGQGSTNLGGSTSLSIPGLVDWTAISICTALSHVHHTALIERSKFCHYHKLPSRENIDYYTCIHYLHKHDAALE